MAKRVASNPDSGAVCAPGLQPTPCLEAAYFTPVGAEVFGNRRFQRQALMVSVELAIMRDVSCDFLNAPLGAWSS